MAPMSNARAEEAQRVIHNLGGTGAVAELCDLRGPSISEWKRKGLPKGWRAFLLLAHPEAFERRPGKRRGRG